MARISSGRRGTAEKAAAAGKSVTGKVTGVACELSDPKSVRACVETVKGLGVKLDVIIANAGIMALPKLKQAFGYELQFFTNHIGHFMLVTGLLDILSDDARGGRSLQCRPFGRAQGRDRIRQSFG